VDGNVKFILLLSLFYYGHLGKKIGNALVDRILYFARRAEQFTLQNFSFILLLNNEDKISFAYRAA
jgi:hypothetical protein